jgi:hypothetical protein
MKRLISILAFSATFFLFYEGLSIQYYNYAPFFISLLGCSLTGIALLFVIRTFVAKKVNSRLVIFFLPIFFLIFFIHFDSKVLDEVRKNGEKACATVVSTRKISTLKGTVHQVFFTFQTQNGEKLEGEKSIDALQFNSLKKGMQIEIMYSKVHPEIVYLFVGDDSILKYIGRKDKTFHLNDLINLLDMNSYSEVYNYLSIMNPGWEEDTEEGLGHYVNKRKKYMIFIVLKQSIDYYAYPNGEIALRFKHDLEDAKYIRQEHEEEIIYVKNNYSVNVNFCSTKLADASVKISVKLAKQSSTTAFCSSPFAGLTMIY